MSILYSEGWVDVPFNAGDFTATGSMTWTVDSGDVTEFKYLKATQNLVIVQFSISTTTIAGPVSPTLQIKIPGSILIQNVQSINAVIHINDAGIRFQGFVQMQASLNTLMQIFKNDLSNFTVGTNLTGVYGTVIFKGA